MPDTKPSFPHDLTAEWLPDAGSIARSNLFRFMDRHGISSLDELQSRSVADSSWFWGAVLDDLGIRFRKPYSKVVDLSRGPAFPKWCVDGRMNIVDNAIDKWLETGETASRPAIIWEGEEGATRQLSYADLNTEVCRCANALTSLGLQKGDAVGLYMPMSVELVVAFLATIKLGGVVLPLFSGYGPSAVATRLKDADARFLFASDGMYRRGKVVNMKDVVDESLVDCGVSHVIVHRRTGADVGMTPGRDIWWNDIVPPQRDAAETVDTLAEDRLMIIYTSGTTGRPKGAVHTHCGFPIKGAQDMYHAMDVKPGEVMYWMSDMGWMMGPWLVFGTLLIGATMVLYDGAPDYPDVDRTWSIVARNRVTHLGVSPVLIRALMPHGTDPIHRHDIDCLRALCSTGSPWDPESWRWTFNNVLDRTRPILNYSGGTEISGGILCGNLFRPLKPCSFSGPVPGMDADIVDDNGNSVTGTVGELVIRKPWIGMTRGFWNDDDRYVESYWSKFKDVWVHGDFALVDDDGLWYVLGRSDDTIKIAGKRVGPAEVEAIACTLDGILECAAVGVPDAIKGESLVVFCVLRDPDLNIEALRATVTRLIGEGLGKPLRPSGVYFVESLPKTRNAKVMRRLVRAAHLGLDLGNTTALESEDAIAHVRAAR